MKLVLCIIFTLIVILGAVLIFITNALIKELEGKVSYFEYIVNIKDQRIKELEEELEFNRRTK